MMILIGENAVLDPKWVEYGVEGAIFFVGMLILLIFALWLKKMIESVNQRMDQQDKRAQAQDKRAMTQDEHNAQLLENISSNTEHKHTAESERSDSKTRKEIMFALRELLKKSSGARAYFVVYHNGVWINNGFRLPRMSIYCELINGVDVDPITPQLQGMPRSYLPIFDSAMNDKAIRCDFLHIEDLKTLDPMTYSWLHGHNVTGCISLEVTDMERHYPVGFIMVEFDANHYTTLDHKTLDIAIHNAAESIATVLHFTDSDDAIISGKLNIGKGGH